MAQKYVYQQDNSFFAQVADGLEEFGAQELEELGAEDCTTVYRGVWFEADLESLYRINYCSRIPTRILAPLMRFNCHSEKYLYSRALEIDWDDFFSCEQTFAVFANVSNSRIDHSQYAALRVKDAVADYFREKTGMRPSVNPRTPDVWLHLHLSNDRAVISLDCSGGSLHRRGYRRQSIDAPMQENVAAAIVRMSGWDGEQPLIDPMCGSGTILCEAVMKYCRIPASVNRSSFGFENMPDFQPDLWKKVKSGVDAEIRPLPAGLVFGGDIDDTAVKCAEENLNTLDCGPVELACRDFKTVQAVENSVIITNPPYGIRMNKGKDMDMFYKELGDFLKQKCKGSTAYIYFGDRSFIKKIGLRTTWKKPVKNGGLDGRLVKLEMY